MRPVKWVHSQLRDMEAMVEIHPSNSANFLIFNWFFRLMHGYITRNAGLVPECLPIPPLPFHKRVQHPSLPFFRSIMSLVPLLIESARCSLLLSIVLLPVGTSDSLRLLHITYYMIRISQFRRCTRCMRSRASTYAISLLNVGDAGCFEGIGELDVEIGGDHQACYDCSTADESLPY